MKVIAIRCDYCGRISQALDVKWREITVDKNSHLIKVAKRQGWTFDDCDICAKCSQEIKDFGKANKTYKR